MTRRPRAAIVGLAGPSLSDPERALLAASPPAGVILFARNCASRDQLRTLVAEIGRLGGGRPTPVLIDQEGGRVMRLRPPSWRHLPTAAACGCLPAADGERAAYLTARLIAHDLGELGIRIDCAPVADLAHQGATTAIGDRAYAADPACVTRLAGAAIRGLKAGGVAPVLKHLPGHGRAAVDSHASLPVIDAPLAELEASDFRPFRALAPLVDLAMTAHVVLTSVDPARPATQSPAVIARLIRGHIGFRGLLLSDDLAMGALAGTAGARAAAAIAAGCDLALHCSGRIEETEQVLRAAGAASGRVLDALARSVPEGDRQRFDAAEAEAELNELLGLVAA